MADLEREQYLYLTTRGRKTGRPREIEIWFTYRAGRFYIIAEFDTSNWLQNVRAQAEVQIRVAEESFPAYARILASDADGELRSQIQELSRTKYGWGDGTVVELVPQRHGNSSK